MRGRTSSILVRLLQRLITNRGQKRLLDNENSVTEYLPFDGTCLASLVIPHRAEFDALRLAAHRMLLAAAESTPI